tara:strand:+ start:301 stop:762 length:462 start_codon:yes stop_codon:yes gene_type:complete
MNKKIFTIFLIFLSVVSCGFTPVALYKENLNINVNILDYEGDYQVNSALRSKLSVHKNNESNKEYEIVIKTKYEKNDLSKDASGNIENYQLMASTTFEISKRDAVTNTITFSEKFTMENFSDDFQEESYEKEIKENFAESIYNKFISHILQDQ